MVLAPTFAFEGREDIGYQITEQAAAFFNVSVRAVHACGSAKLGFSPHKGTEFAIGTSDLDLAIIDENCFTRYVGEPPRLSRRLQLLRGWSND
jgi:hypothetical protein